jgi:hypothetical protein
MEGIAGALTAVGGHDHDHSRQLLEEARKDLATDGIFDEQYWAPDGTWKYEVASASKDSDIIFEDVAFAHPLISKWTHIVDGEVTKWNIRRGVLDVAQELHPEVVPELKEVKIEQQARKVLDW